MTIEDYQSQVDAWIKKYGVRYFDPCTNGLLLNEEVGELSRLIARVFGEQSFKSDIDKQSAKQDIEDELSDILFVIACLANQMEIDLTASIERNFEKKTARDINRHKKNTKL